MRSSRRIASNNHLSQHDSTVAEAAKKRQEEKFLQHLGLAQTSPVSQLLVKRKSTIAGLAKRNSGSQILMPEPETPPDINEQSEADLLLKQVQNEQLQYFKQIANRFMEQGLDNPYPSSEDVVDGQVKKNTEKSPAVTSPKAETDDVKFLQQEKPNITGVAVEEEIPEYETMEMQTKKVSRIKMRFKLIVASSTLPKKMPETIVYWNRCETKISQESQSILSQQKLDDFNKIGGVRLHDYPDARQKVANNFPFLDNKRIWADPLQEQFVNPMESLIYYSAEMKQWISQLNNPRAVEGHIVIENLRDTDVFFNSKFESGNLKQAFIVPQPLDYDELTDEEAMIGDYLPKEEKEYLRSMLDKRREKRRETAQKSVNESKLLKKSWSDKELESPATQQKNEQTSFQPSSSSKPQPGLKESPTETKILKTNPSDPQIKKAKKQSFISSEYNLYLQEDTHSDGSRTQWFYFSVMNIKGGTNVKFNIVNMTKPDSSFQKGMQPLVFSTKKFSKTGQGWHRAGKNITYQKNSRTQRSQIKVMDIKYLQGQQSQEQQPDSFKELSTLSFEYKFKFDQDVLYFAHGQPYTYSDHANFICKLEAETSLADRLRIDHLCNSVGKNPVYCLTITNKIQTKYVSQSKEYEKWQKFEYSFNQNADLIKPKKQKREEVSDEEELKIQPIFQSQNTKSKIYPSVHIPQTTGVEVPPLRQEKLSKIVEVQHDTESNIQHDFYKKSEEVNQHFDQKPNFDISSDEEDHKKKKNVASKEMKDKFYKKVIVITSRVHPGETQSSFMVEGLISYLLSDADEAREIREKFVIKIVPMLNPDGVILGNTRSSLIGVDLNRRWLKPSKFLHPSIYYTKSLIKYLNKKLHQPEVKSGGVVLFTDLHGHNKNMDIFMYGCVVERDYAYHEGNMLIRQVPDGVDRLIPVFSSQKCKFAVESDKVETGRIVVFREFNILNSYTLECSFHGSEHLQRTKQIYMALYSQDYLQDINQRYQISAQRKNIHFDINTYFQAAADFIRGVNWASKRKPILSNWFRVEPKNIVDPASNTKPDAEAEIEEYLKELENKWRPTGNILDDGKQGMTEKYGGLSLPYIFDGPISVDDKLEKVARRKKEKAEREQKKRQQESMLKYSKMSGSKETRREQIKVQPILNADIAEVSKPNSRQNSTSKLINKGGIQDKTFKRKAKGLKQSQSQDNSISNQSEDYEEDSENGSVRDKQSQRSFEKRSMNQTAREISRNQIVSTKKLLMSPSPNKRVVNIQKDSSGKASHSGGIAKDMYETTQSFQQHSILRDELFEVVGQKDSSKKKRIQANQQVVSSKVNSSKEQKKGGRNDMRQNLSQQRASKNQYKMKVDIPAIENQLVLEVQNSASGNDKSKFGLSIKDHTLENFARLSIINQSSQDVTSPRLAVENRSASRKQYKRISFGSSIESESETDELKLPPIFPKSQSLNSQNNLLSSDPLVVSSKQLQQISKVNLQTIASNNRDFSPFKSPSSKGIFAPINAVYSQRSLMSNSGLAGKQNINFFMEQSSVLKERKMTQLYQANKQLDAIKAFQSKRPRLTSDEYNKSPAKAIEIKNGFELSPRRFEDSAMKETASHSVTKKLKQLSRPHIILKPLSEVDWITLQQSPIRSKHRMYNDLTEEEQRETLRTLQKVVGTLEIKQNKLKIGRNPLLPMIESHSQGKQSSLVFGQTNIQIAMYEESLRQGSVNNNYKWPLVRTTPFQEAIKILKDLQREK